MPYRTGKQALSLLLMSSGLPVSISRLNILDLWFSYSTNDILHTGKKMFEISETLQTDISIISKVTPTMT